MSIGYHACGKQILQDNEHIADARDDATANMIAEALNIVYTPPAEELTISMRGADEMHVIRQENDEYACSCGMRWDVREGIEHP